MEITRERVIHLLKVGVWQELKKHKYYSTPWKHLYMCGPNIVAIATTREELAEKIKSSDIPLFPKVIYAPPQRNRKEYFDGSDDVLPCDEQLSFVTCVMPLVWITPVESYELTPFEISYMSEGGCAEQILTLIMIMKRKEIKLPRQLFMFMHQYLLRTTNRGFTLSEVRGDDLIE